jgi:LDH2 family malate/lactate/ureidoglycolate dehydrogenase
MTPSPATDALIPVDRLVTRIERLFVAAGLSSAAAAHMADALVEADLEGVPSHGTLQAEMYIRRLRLGSISALEQPEVVVDRQAMAVLDAHHMFGHIAADHAIALAVTKAKSFGVGTVAVRHGFHFGTAGRYARKASEAGCIGIAMSNVRPLIPAPGGAERLVGNNPLAIAIPSAGTPPIVLDMAMSEAALAKIRVAQARGAAIPPTWAVTADGAPTTDPAEALSGMLQPTGGAKGFGLAFVIDLMCGLLSSGAWGDRVNGMYTDPAIPLDCAFLFIAIDVGHFRDLDGFKGEASAAADRVRASKRAPGVDRITVPGERKWLARQAAGDKVRLPAEVDDALTKLETELGIAPVAP